MIEIQNMKENKTYAQIEKLKHAQKKQNEKKNEKKKIKRKKETSVPVAWSMRSHGIHFSVISRSPNSAYTNRKKWTELTQKHWKCMKRQKGSTESSNAHKKYYGSSVVVLSVAPFQLLAAASFPLLRIFVFLCILYTMSMMRAYLFVFIFFYSVLYPQLIICVTMINYSWGSVYHSDSVYLSFVTVVVFLVCCRCDTELLFLLPHCVYHV